MCAGFGGEIGAADRAERLNEDDLWGCRCDYLRLCTEGAVRGSANSPYVFCTGAAGRSVGALLWR